MTELINSDFGTWMLCGYHLAVRDKERGVFTILLPMDVVTSYERVVLH